MQIVHRVELVDAQMYADEVACLTRLATERDAICKSELRVPPAYGKRVLLTVLAGGAPPEDMSDVSFLKQVPLWITRLKDALSEKKKRETTLRSLLFILRAVASHLALPME